MQIGSFEESAIERENATFTEMRRSMTFEKDFSQKIMQSFSEEILYQN